MSPIAVDPARDAAFELLRRVHVEDAYANLVMPEIIDEFGLSGRDAGFATELGYGTLRLLGRHDALIAACVSRPIDDLDPALHAILRLGVHQLTSMRVPAHAAVSTSVDLARAAIGAGPARMANAVLRRVAATPLDDWLTDLEQGLEEGDRLALRHSHPRWAVDALDEALSAVGRGDELELLLAANNTPAPVHLVARRITRDALLRIVPEGVPTAMSPFGVRMAHGDPGDLAAVRDGSVGVQDVGSQAVALALADAELAPGGDRRWLDLCAGPGGKAALLAGRAEERGASLTAVEVHPHRAHLVRRALEGMGSGHRVIVDDGTAFSDPHGGGVPFDRVLVDAPCTGLGAIRRRPESRWRERDLAELSALQRDLLANAVRLTRSGGAIMYATCSPHAAETTEVTEWACARLPVRPGPVIRTWPHTDDADAMFGQILHRS